MDEISRFRGMAGEVTGGFLLPMTLFSALPILIVFAVLGFAAGMLKGGAQIIAAPVMFAAYVMVVGRFALPARHGIFEGGFLIGSSTHGELPGFIGRYLLLTLAWSVPLALLAWLAVDRESLFYASMTLFPTDVMVGGGRLQSVAPSPLDALQSGVAALLLPILGLAALFMPTLCFIVATRAETLSEALSKETWGWLLSHRRADLPAFYVGLIGGMIVFFGVYLIPFTLVSFIAFKISPQAGMAVSGFLYMLGFAATPILLGRMCGAFIAGEEGLEAQEPDMPSGSAPPTYFRPESPPPAEQPMVIEKKPGFDELLAKVRALPLDALIGEIKKAEESLAARPRDPHTAVELAMLFRKAGEREKSLKAAADAITQAVRDGFAELGASLFRGFAKERAELGLNALTLEVIGNVLLKQGLPLDAGWCLYESASSAGDALKAQKKLLHVANLAEEAGKHAEAVLLYDFFIAKYADTPLTQFAKQGRERAQAAKG